VQPAAPGAVGQDHGLGHDQIQRRATRAGADVHLLVALRLDAIAHGVDAVGADELEAVVRAVEGLGLAAHHFALRLQVLGQAEGKGQLGREGIVGRGLATQCGVGDDAIELVVAQVGGDRHALQFGLGARDRQRGFIKRDVQRHGRAVAPFDQRVGLHHAVGQHGDLVAGHVDGGHARAAELVDRRARCDGQARCGDVDAIGDAARAQALHRQRIVDLGGHRVVDGEGAHGGQWQFVLDGRGFQGREARALGEVLEQEALEVELVGAVDGACVFQQVQRRALRGLGSLDHGLVGGAVLVGLEEDLVELVLDGGGAAAGGQLLGPLGDLQGLLLLALDGGQGLLEDVFGGLLEATLAPTVEVVRRVEQAHQHGGLLHGVGRRAEVLARQFVKAEVFFGGHFPDQIQVDVAGLGGRLRQQLGRRRLGELQQHVGGLGLHALARVKLDLHRGIGFGHHTAGQELASVIKEGVHELGVFRSVSRGLSHFGITWLEGC